MAKQNKRLTVIVVPQTARRTYTFTIAPVWLTALLLIGAGLAGGLWHYHNEAKALRGELGELESLRKTNRLQQAEIHQMQETARTVQERLREVELLEQQIKALTGEETEPPSRSNDLLKPAPAARGGPGVDTAQRENLPTLASILPSDLKPYILGRRDTLALDLRLARVGEDPATSLETARGIQEAFHEQITALERKKEVLGEGREEIAAHMEYLAHRPTGWPIWGATVTDRFGTRWSPFGWGQQLHDGLDFAHNYWEPIYATADGVVIHAGWRSGGYGYTVIIEHGHGFTTLYAHMVDWNVEDGQSVKRGDLIGWVGNTGLSTGPHLHYEVHVNGVSVDPAPYLQ